MSFKQVTPGRLRINAPPNVAADAMEDAPFLNTESPAKGMHRKDASKYRYTASSYQSNTPAFF